MRALLIFALFVCTASSLSCPQTYDPHESIGCIRPIFISVYESLDQLLHFSRSECAKDGAHLPVITNEQEDKMFNLYLNMLPDNYLVLDVVCNATTRRLQWLDGSPITYPQYLVSSIGQLDCFMTRDTVASLPSAASWYRIHAPQRQYLTILCVIDETRVTTGSPIANQKTENPTTTDIEIVATTLPRRSSATFETSAQPTEQSVAHEICPKDPPSPDEDFNSPGFPYSLAPCEYVLLVEADKLVKFEVLMLITYQNKDILEIFEGPAGSDLIANLTGTIVAPTTFTTTKSNVMRVNWKPNREGSESGFQVKYSVVGSGAMTSYSIVGLIMPMLLVFYSQ